jgi:hypothetical protein
MLQFSTYVPEIESTVNCGNRLVDKENKSLFYTFTRYVGAWNRRFMSSNSYLYRTGIWKRARPGLIVAMLHLRRPMPLSTCQRQVTRTSHLAALGGPNPGSLSPGLAADIYLLPLSSYSSWCHTGDALPMNMNLRLQSAWYGAYHDNSSRIYSHHIVQPFVATT